MKREWLTERCEAVDPKAIRLHEMNLLELSDDAKNRLLERSEQFQKWVADKWNPFIAELLPRDELWRFRSPEDTWAKLAGCAGYAIVRNGEIVRTLTTLRS